MLRLSATVAHVANPSQDIILVVEIDLAASWPKMLSVAWRPWRRAAGGTPVAALAGLVIAVVRHSILVGPARSIAWLVTRELLSEVERVVRFEREADIVPSE
jgi:hypothetical protein